MINSIKYFLSLNFTDKAGRINTTRIGQWVGVFAQLIITYYSLWLIIWAAEDNLERIVMLSIISAIPMILYSLKSYAGKEGNQYERKDKYYSIRKMNKIKSFFSRNFLDGYARISTRRIGQMSGMIAMVIFTIWALIMVIFGNESQLKLLSEMNKLKLFTANALTPMILYQLKDLKGSVIQSMITEMPDKITKAKKININIKKGKTTIVNSTES